MRDNVRVGTLLVLLHGTQPDLPHLSVLALFIRIENCVDPVPNFFQLVFQLFDALSKFAVGHADHLLTGSQLRFLQPADRATDILPRSNPICQRRPKSFDDEPFQFRFWDTDTTTQLDVAQFTAKNLLPDRARLPSRAGCELFYSEEVS